MPATGNNDIKTNKILSIRLSPDGLSFWTSRPCGKDTAPGRISFSDPTSVIEEKYVAFDNRLERREAVKKAVARCLSLAGHDEFPVVEIYPDTRKGVLVPASLYDAENPEELLLMNNMAPEKTERVYTIEVAPQIKAVIAFDNILMGELLNIPANRHLTLSPFALNLEYPYRYEPKKKHRDRLFCAVCLTNSNAYITVERSDGGQILYCDVFPYSATADLVYYVTEVTKLFPLEKSILYIRGRKAKEHSKPLGKPFRKVICE